MDFGQFMKTVSEKNASITLGHRDSDWTTV